MEELVLGSVESNWKNYVKLNCSAKMLNVLKQTPLTVEPLKITHGACCNRMYNHSELRFK